VPSTESAPPSALPPAGIRVATTLCAVTGVVGALRTVGIENEVASQPTAPRLLMVTNPTAVLAVLVAAVLIWKRRRLGAYLLIAGAIGPHEPVLWATAATCRRPDGSHADRRSRELETSALGSQQSRRETSYR
jgi:hypothetical protein